MAAQRNVNGAAVACAGGVLCSGDQRAPDGGLDLSVELPVATKMEGWVPRPVTGFQVKKQGMSRGKILAEMRPWLTAQGHTIIAEAQIRADDEAEREIDESFEQ